MDQMQAMKKKTGSDALPWGIGKWSKSALSEYDKEEVVRLFEDGFSTHEIAKIFDVHESYVYNLRYSEQKAKEK